MIALAEWAGSDGLSDEQYSRHQQGKAPLRETGHARRKRGRRGCQMTVTPDHIAYQWRLRPPQAPEASEPRPEGRRTGKKRPDDRPQPPRAAVEWQARQITRTSYGWDPAGPVSDTDVAEGPPTRQPVAEPEIIWIRDCVGIQIGAYNSQTDTYDIVLSKLEIALDEDALAMLLALISQGAEDGFRTDIHLPGIPALRRSPAKSFIRRHPDDTRLIVVRRSCGVQIGNRCFQRNTFTLRADGFLIRIDSLHLRSGRRSAMRRLLADPHDRDTAAMIARDIVERALATLLTRLEREFEHLTEPSLITGLRSLYRRIGVSMGFRNTVRLRRRFDASAIRIALLRRVLTEQILRYAQRHAATRQATDEPRASDEQRRPPDAREEPGSRSDPSDGPAPGRPDVGDFWEPFPADDFRGRSAARDHRGRDTGETYCGWDAGEAHRGREVGEDRTRASAAADEQGAHPAPPGSHGRPTAPPTPEPAPHAAASHAPESDEPAERSKPPREVTPERSATARRRELLKATEQTGRAPGDPPAHDSRSGPTARSRPSLLQPLGNPSREPHDGLVCPTGSPIFCSEALVRALEDELLPAPEDQRGRVELPSSPGRDGPGTRGTGWSPPPPGSRDISRDLDLGSPSW
ncbi:hypothetical protein B0I32_13927 [Nonomuraea fuscirosea]|uniref:Uncharacterized protein n=1 Tax=Nonomuraea fuscirosea TaxID=1291556 RepID=A0A2T0LXU0_9ACTN|nr:hypothetical protein [Nonomuraea fuscirosea]PRX48934.1 hypothetical protein B0I32_13927 [Nonomuraea fuscirosea]